MATHATRRFAIAAAAFSAVGLSYTPAATAAPAGPIGNKPSVFSSVSADGRYVVFDSRATNLVRGDTNATSDIYLRDRVAKTTRRISAPRGGQANGGSFFPTISDSGRYVAYASDATNLVPGDTNGKRDVFRTDTVTGATIRVSTTLSGAQANGASGNGRISGDGQVVAFTSAATNLTRGDTNGKIDAFIRHYRLGTLTLISKKPSGAQSTEDVTQLDLAPNGRRAGWMWGYDTAMEWARGSVRTNTVEDPAYSLDPTSVAVNNNHVGLLSQADNAAALAPNGNATQESLYWFSVYFDEKWDQTPAGDWSAYGYYSGDDDTDYVEISNPTGTSVKRLEVPGWHTAISNDASTVTFYRRDTGQIYAWTPATRAVEIVSRATG